eukprot:scaffold27813_cov63-Phaeocystis_antarctica.AAC.2
MLGVPHNPDTNVRYTAMRYILTYLLSHFPGQNMTEHNPAPSRSGHPLRKPLRSSPDIHLLDLSRRLGVSRLRRLKRVVMWSVQAQAEGLTLLVADNTTGYFGVGHNKPGQSKPYMARVRRGSKQVHLGSFATAEEAALHVARTPEGRAAAERAAEAPPLTSEEARQQAQAEGLTLHVADNKTGYLCVYLTNPGQPKPYMARVRRDDQQVSLGSFATAEEAALCVARSPEGQAAAATAAEKAAAAPPLKIEEVRQQAQAE